MEHYGLCLFNKGFCCHVSADDSVQDCDQAVFSHCWTALTVEANLHSILTKYLSVAFCQTLTRLEWFSASCLELPSSISILKTSFLLSISAHVPVFHLAEAKFCTRSENSNKVRNLGLIHGCFSGHLPKVARVADTTPLHKRFVAQHKNGKDCFFWFGWLSKGTPVESIKVVLFLYYIMWWDGPEERQRASLGLKLAYFKSNLMQHLFESSQCKPRLTTSVSCVNMPVGRGFCLWLNTFLIPYWAS